MSTITTTAKVRKNNPFPCIFTQKTNGKDYFVVKVTINRKRIYVGCYKTHEDAVIAHKEFMLGVEQFGTEQIEQKAPVATATPVEGFL